MNLNELQLWRAASPSRPSDSVQVVEVVRSAPTGHLLQSWLGVVSVLGLSPLALPVELGLDRHLPLLLQALGSLVDPGQPLLVRLVPLLGLEGLLDAPLQVLQNHLSSPTSPVSGNGAPSHLLPRRTRRFLPLYH